MNRSEFISVLTRALKENKITDVDDIVSEYEAHFRFKMQDGYSEEEIASKLGDPEMLARQFDPGIKTAGKTKGGKVLTAFALAFFDVFVVAFFIVLLTWAVAMAIATVSFTALGVCLAGDINVYNLIPEMPYWSSLIFSVCMFSLAILSAVGTVYFFSFTRQLMLSYIRFHKNALSVLAGGPVYPSLARHPRLNDKARRLLRSITLITLIIFVLSCITAFVVSMLSAGALGFWHQWNWFVR
ncbi:MAG: DUF1700 domain-containing protein [Clostridia bacterium]